MNNGPAYFEIQATKPAEAVQFYSAVFGWKCTKDEKLPIEYWRIESDGARGAILQRPAPVPPPHSGTNAFVCSMEVTDFDGTAETVIKNGGAVAMAKFPIPGKCWQGYFLDPEGNTFGIFQVDAKAA